MIYGRDDVQPWRHPRRVVVSAYLYKKATFADLEPPGRRVGGFRLA